MDEYTYDVLRTSKAVFTLLDQILQWDKLSPSEKLEMESLRSKLETQADSDGTICILFKDIQLLHHTLKLVRESEGMSNCFNRLHS